MALYRHNFKNCFNCNKQLDIKERRFRVKYYVEDETTTYKEVDFCYECFKSSAPEDLINNLESQDDDSGGKYSVYPISNAPYPNTYGTEWHCVNCDVMLTLGDVDVAQQVGEHICNKCNYHSTSVRIYSYK